MTNSYPSRATHAEQKRQLAVARTELDDARAKLAAVKQVHAGCPAWCPTLTAMADEPPKKGARHGRDT